MLYRCVTMTMISEFIACPVLLYVPGPPPLPLSRIMYDSLLSLQPRVGGAVTGYPPLVPGPACTRPRSLVRVSRARLLMCLPVPSAYHIHSSATVEINGQITEYYNHG